MAGRDASPAISGYSHGRTPMVFQNGIVELPVYLLIALVIMLFFGAAKLPKLGKGLGEGIRNFKKGLKSNNKDEKPEDKKLEAGDAVESDKK